jgi:DNA-binding Lrp family transcriptional regulator
MDEIDRLIINSLQIGFPVCDAPFKQVAIQLGLTELELINRLQQLLDKGFLTRFGPMYHAELLGGALTLAAVKAPQEHFEEIAEIINAHPEVAHNYARNHSLNMWFVIATQTPELLEQTLESIQQQTGLQVYNMPKINEFFVGLQLEA